MMRRTSGSRGVDQTAMSNALKDGKVWCGLGIVVKRQGEQQHYEISDEDVLVSVDLMPEGQPLWCRLGGKYMWRVPPVGSEVMVAMPAGELEQMPSIVTVLSTGEVDGDLDGDVLLIVNSKKVVIKSTDDQVILGGTSGKEIARKGDNLTASQALKDWAQAVEAGVSAGGGGAIAPNFASVAGIAGGVGTINQGSSKAKAAD